MNPVKIIIGFVPLIAFSLLAPWTGPGYAAISGLACILGLLILSRTPGRSPGSLKVLPLAQAVILAIVAVIGLTAGSTGVGVLLADYGRGLVSLALAVFILVTASFMPFTAQFAGGAGAVLAQPRVRRGQPEAEHAWGAAMLSGALGHLAAGALAASGQGSSLGILVLDWGLPVAGIVLALRYTRKIADAGARTQPVAASPS